MIFLLIACFLLIYWMICWLIDWLIDGMSDINDNWDKTELWFKVFSFSPQPSSFSATWTVLSRIHSHPRPRWWLPWAWTWNILHVVLEFPSASASTMINGSKSAIRSWSSAPSTKSAIHTRTSKSPTSVPAKLTWVSMTTYWASEWVVCRWTGATMRRFILF